jgi:hypothetical protein
LRIPTLGASRPDQVRDLNVPPLDRVAFGSFVFDDLNLGESRGSVVMVRHVLEPCVWN